MRWGCKGKMFILAVMFVTWYNENIFSKFPRVIQILTLVPHYMVGLILVTGSFVGTSAFTLMGLLMIFYWIGYPFDFEIMPRMEIITIKDFIIAYISPIYSFANLTFWLSQKS